jgi:hypothetical protein
VTSPRITNKPQRRERGTDVHNSGEYEDVDLPGKAGKTKHEERQKSWGQMLDVEKEQKESEQSEITTWLDLERHKDTKKLQK